MAARKKAASNESTVTVLEQARDAAESVKPLTPAQKERLRYWDYFEYWVGEGIAKQQRERERERERVTD